MIRIIYGTGKVVPVSSFEQEISPLFDLTNLSYVHARSPPNNCYHSRIETGLRKFYATISACSRTRQSRTVDVERRMAITIEKHE